MIEQIPTGGIKVADVLNHLPLFEVLLGIEGNCGDFNELEHPLRMLLLYMGDEITSYILYIIV